MALQRFSKPATRNVNFNAVPVASLSKLSSAMTPAESYAKFQSIISASRSAKEQKFNRELDQRYYEGDINDVTRIDEQIKFYENFKTGASKIEKETIDNSINGLKLSKMTTQATYNNTKALLDFNEGRLSEADYYKQKISFYEHQLTEEPIQDLPHEQDDIKNTIYGLQETLSNFYESSANKSKGDKYDSIVATMDDRISDAREKMLFLDEMSASGKWSTGVIEQSKGVYESIMRGAYQQAQESIDSFGDDELAKSFEDGVQGSGYSYLWDTPGYSRVELGDGSYDYQQHTTPGIIGEYGTPLYKDDMGYWRSGSATAIDSFDKVGWSRQLNISSNGQVEFNLVSPSVNSIPFRSDMYGQGLSVQRQGTEGNYNVDIPTTINGQPSYKRVDIEYKDNEYKYNGSVISNKNPLQSRTVSNDVQRSNSVNSYFFPEAANAKSNIDEKRNIFSFLWDKRKSIPINKTTPIQNLPPGVNRPSSFAN